MVRMVLRWLVVTGVRRLKTEMKLIDGLLKTKILDKILLFIQKLLAVTRRRSES